MKLLKPIYMVLLIAILGVLVACSANETADETAAADIVTPNTENDESVENTVTDDADESGANPTLANGGAAAPDISESFDGSLSIMEILSTTGDLTSLYVAVSCAGMDDLLAEEGSYTLIAPSNEAFQTTFASLGIDSDALMQNMDLLTTILDYHILEEPVDIMTMLFYQQLDTRLGEPILIETQGGEIYLNSATFLANDIQASNGIIHVVNQVLIPQSVLSFFTNPIDQ